MYPGMNPQALASARLADSANWRAPTPEETKVATLARTLRFGVELEVVGIDERAIAKAAAKALNYSEPETYNGGYPVYDSQRRCWEVVSDGSLSDPSGELVTPPLTYADIPLLQEVARAIHKAGGRVSYRCGMHVHVDAGDLTVAGLVNLCEMVRFYERTFPDVLGVQDRRVDRYCRPVKWECTNALFFHGETGEWDNIANSDEDARQEFYIAFHDYDMSSCRAERYSENRYCDARYHGLNVHSVFHRGTTEFRWFEGTLHGGEIRANVLLCLGMAAAARLMPNPTRAPQETLPEVRCTVTAVLRLLSQCGMVGEEFTNPRLHILRRIRPSAQAALDDQGRACTAPVTPTPAQARVAPARAPVAPATGYSMTPPHSRTVPALAPSPYSF